MQQDSERFKRKTWHSFGDLEMEGGMQSGDAGGFEERLHTNREKKAQLCKHK